MINISAEVFSREVSRTMYRSTTQRAGVNKVKILKGKSFYPLLLFQDNKNLYGLASIIWPSLKLPNMGLIKRKI